MTIDERIGSGSPEGYVRARQIFASDDPVHQRQQYLDALEATSGRSIMAGTKLQNLYLLLKEYVPTLGAAAVVECGSYRGGSALFMASLLKRLAPSMNVYACDTFTGMPTSAGIDLHQAGDFAEVDLPGLYAARDAAGLDNLVIVPGLIEDTLPGLKTGGIGLLHIDMDIYSACKTATELLWPRLVPGGYVVFDDADFWTCLGATRAAEEFMMERRIHSDQVDPHWVYRKPL